MQKLLIPVAAVIVLVGCAASAARGIGPATFSATAPMTNLDGTSWRFVEIGGMPVPAGVAATLRMRHGRAGGRAGCNSFGATYSVGTDGSASIKLGMSTKMACVKPAGAGRVERGIFAAFRQTVAVEFRAGDLVLLGAGRRPLARLVREDPRGH